jgi:tRNA-dihydrouridine synthase A
MNHDLLSIAPMIDWSNPPFRIFMRLLAPQALVYTEMQTVGAIKNKPARALQYSKQEHPIALQIGGSDPKELAYCAHLGEQAGFDEVNLNLGCPSDKVQAGRFGACLMGEPQTAARCLEAMKAAVKIPVTAKIRLGIDNQDSYDFFSSFVHQLISTGCDKVIIHARKAWLNGLNPKQNRTIPPINYPYVYAIKQEIPHIPIIVNGNIQTIEAIHNHLYHVDGVMLGRLACDNPYAIAKIHHALYPNIPLISYQDLISTYLSYAADQQKQGTAVSILMKPIFNLAHGLPGASFWKQQLMLAIQGKVSIDQLYTIFPATELITL